MEYVPGKGELGKILRMPNVGFSNAWLMLYYGVV